MNVSGDTDIRKKKSSSSILQIQAVQNYLEIDTLEELQLLANKEELLDDVKAKGSLGCSERETVEFQILGGASKTKNRITTTDLR